MQKGENQKHIVVLLGSPRKKGNSTVLAKQIIHGIESVGAKVETVYLNGLNIKPCQGCYACKKKNSTGCAVDDDMQSLYRQASFGGSSASKPPDLQRYGCSPCLRP